VPNFGQDHDIANSLSNLKNAEVEYGNWDLPTEDVQLTREPLLSWKPVIAKPSHPMDYPVPDFGVDHDIQTSQANEGAAQDLLAWKWNLDKDEASGKFIVPDSNLDNLKINPEDRFPALDFVQTDSGSLYRWDLKKDEASGKFIVPDSNIDNLRINPEDRFPALDFVQTGREPLLSWKPVIAKPSHPMDYPVPDFGADHEMIASKEHEGAAEDLLAHKWKLQKDEKTEKWIVPPSDVEFKIDDNARFPVLDFAQRKADVSYAQLESDPICATSGCPKTAEEKKKPPVVYNMYPSDYDLEDES